jgi:hypothetical protein
LCELELFVCSLLCELELFVCSLLCELELFVCSLLCELELFVCSLLCELELFVCSLLCELELFVCSLLCELLLQTPLHLKADVLDQLLASHAELLTLSLVLLPNMRPMRTPLYKRARENIKHSLFQGPNLNLYY